MRETIWTTLFDNGYMPHGFCLLWEPMLFWAHAASDAVIALSYFSIPAVLVVFALRRADFEYRWVLHLFGAFIIGCGLTHAMEIWTLWVPSYGIEAMVKVATALISIGTAILLWPLLPKILALPSTHELEQRNEALAVAIGSHRAAEAELAALNRELEERVALRTADLASKNEELAQATAEAREANEAKTRFLSMMSHEIRTPLNAVINMVDLLMETRRTAADLGYLRTMATSSRALLEIVEEILDFSRIEAGHLEIATTEAEVEAIVEDVVQSVAPLAHRKGLDIAVTVGGNVPATAVLDPARVRQVLLNLVGNAVNYTREGWVHVDVDLLDRPEGHALVFEVVDTGIGIAETDYERIFERFSKLDPDRDGTVSGTGLGLSISRSLAQAMGGSIEVSSRPGQGSAFRFTLPIPDSAPPAAPACRLDVVMIGPPSRSRQSLATTIVGLGAELRTLDGAPGDHAEPCDVALVVLPVGSTDRSTIQRWCRLASDIGARAFLFVPVGQAGAEVAALVPEGVRIETYPIGRAALAAILTEDPAAAAAAADPVQDIGGARVLVVDDNEENRLAAEHGLSHAGAEVTTVSDGEAAIAAVAGGSFDIVLLDLRMPGLDGFETAARIRALDGPRGQVPIVAVSANITPETIRRIREVGMTGHLAKPFRPRDLRNKVEAILDGRPEAAAPGDAAPAPVLDEAFLIDSRSMTSPATLRKMIDVFLGGIDSRLQLIEACRTDGERADAVHALAGAAGALGLLELNRLCKSLELSTREGRSNRDDALAAIRGSADRAVSALRRFRDSV